MSVRTAKQILTDHANRFDGGKRIVWHEMSEEECSILSGANLSGADLRWADDGTRLKDVAEWSEIGPGARIARKRRVKRMFLAEAAAGNEQRRAA